MARRQARQYHVVPELVLRRDLVVVVVGQQRQRVLSNRQQRRE